MTLDRRTVALGVAAAGAVTAAVLVTAIGHRSAGSPQRQAVAAYIEQVNAVQNRMHAPLTRVMLAYSSFGRGHSTHSSPTQLATAAATLSRLQRRLTSVACPPEATKLRNRLLVLVHREAEITREVRLLARFSPRYVSTLHGMQSASLTLESSLKRIDVPTAHTLRGTRKAVARARREFAAKAQQAADAQAAAIDTYDRAVAGVLTRLVRLRPPPALTPEYRAQLATLRTVTVAGASLANRLRSAHRSDVAQLSRRFSLASRAAGTLAVQRAQIAAIRAYNKRVRQVGTASAAVQAELARLRRELP